MVVLLANVPPVPLRIHLLAKVPGKAAEDSPMSWADAPLCKNWRKTPGSLLWINRALAIWGVHQWMEDLSVFPSFFITLSFK